MINTTRLNAVDHMGWTFTSKLKSTVFGSIYKIKDYLAEICIISLKYDHYWFCSIGIESIA